MSKTTVDTTSGSEQRTAPKQLNNPRNSPEMRSTALANRPVLSKQSPSADGGQRFLGFTLGDNLNALIPLADLQATIKISLTEILPVPLMKDSLLGIINYRGKATWVLDLAHLMGAPHYHLHTPDAVAGMGMLFQIENETVALLIPRVNTIETYNLQQCLPIGDRMFSDQMCSFLSGYFMDLDQQPWVVVDLLRVTRSII